MKRKIIKKEKRNFSLLTRDKKTGLYPLSLFRKIDEKKSINTNIAIVPLASDMEKKEKRKNEKFSEKELPITIDDAETFL